MNRRAFLKSFALMMGSGLLPGFAVDRLGELEIDLELLRIGIERCSGLILDNLGLVVNVNEIAPLDIFTMDERRERVARHVIEQLTSG